MFVFTNFQNVNLSLCLNITSVLLDYTGVARNFDWEGPKLKKNYDVILVTFFADVMVMTSLLFFKVRFRHNQFEKTQFYQITKLQVKSRNFKSGQLHQNCWFKECWERRATSA